jgi:adenosylcobinamide-GDP ribazoletransferase
VNASAVRSALAFLTVLPVAARDGAPGERLGRALFPAIGLLLGLAAWGALWLGTLAAGPLFGAVAALAALALLTGGLHLDGLADCADGLLASGGRERRLEIMRDPRLGAFGVTALVLVLLADVALLQRLGVGAALPALVAAGAFSRLSMLAVLVALPYARERGLGRAAAGRGPLDLAGGAVLTAPAFLLDWRHAALGLVGAAAAAGIVGALAHRRIGGATGDVYGAVSEMGQVGVLLAFLVPL